MWQREPAMVLALIQSLLALAVGFGAPITSEQMGLLMAFSSALIGLVTRSQVSSTATLTARDKAHASAQVPPATT